MRQSRSVPSVLLWIRALVFTVLVPGLIGVLVPLLMERGRHTQGGPWETGWLLVAAGSTIYLPCLSRFLASGGTPAIFFTRGLRTFIGEEPHTLVQEWLYQISRNPIYVGVLLVVFGQAMVFAAVNVAAYGIVLWLLFHLTVVFQEEPHLRDQYGPSYDDYCRRVPRGVVAIRRQHSASPAAKTT